MTLYDTDKGYRKFYDSLVNQKIPKLYTGILPAQVEGLHGEGPETIGDVAGWMEFGTPTVPERSFIRSFWDESDEYVREQLYLQLKNRPRIFINWKSVLSGVGTWVVTEMRKRMQDIPPELAESTVRKKGHDRPLYDTGELEEAISFEVR
jgi:hypothetical protein